LTPSGDASDSQAQASQAPDSQAQARDEAAPAPARPRPVSGGGAVVRLVLGALITFGVAIQTAHGQGMPINGWVLLGAVVLTLKDAQSYLSQTWGQAFHGEPGPDAAQR